jgi:hypothetical protein
MLENTAAASASEVDLELAEDCKNSSMPTQKDQGNKI